MELADEYLDSASCRSLGACCAAAGVPLAHAHHALADARAATWLLSYCGRQAASSSNPWAVELAAAGRLLWPACDVRGRLVPREVAAYQRATRTSHVAKLVQRLPAGSSRNLDAEAYLAKLDEILEDRMVTDAEGEALAELATDLGIASGDLPAIHFAYLRDLAAVAVADREVTDEERADLSMVAQLLGFPGGAVDAALDAARHQQAASALVSRRPLRPGMLVCFSENDLDKAELEAMATKVGLVTRTTVSKKTDVVVSGDPLSKSAKLEKARTLGKRILLESLFVAMTTEKVEPGGAARSPPTGETAPEPLDRSAPAGWYADPAGQPCFRYWDGVQWTGHVSSPQRR
jgi:DNA polymerase-3 subunit epsilon